MSFLYLLLLALFPNINLNAVCELTCSNDFRDKHGVMVGAVGTGPPMYPMRLLALSIILTCSPNMSFLARLVSDNSGSFEKLELRAPSSPTTFNKQKLSARDGVRVFVRGYRRVRFDLPSSINFRYISGFPKLGAHNQRRR